MTTRSEASAPGPALRILHLANHRSSNVGNGALVQGLERSLREDFARPLRFLAEPWDDYTIPGAPRRFDEGFVERCNQADALLVGAAVTFVGSRDHARTGMRFDLPLPLWERIRCPVVFYGLSHRTWPHQPYAHPEALAAAVEAALRSERMLFSVRNDGTRAWLSERLGIDAEAVAEVPDPALWVPHEPAARPWILDPQGPNLAVSLNDEDPEWRFAAGRAARGAPLGARLGARLKGRPARPPWWKRRREVLRTLARVLDRVVERRGACIVLCPHHHEDFRLVADFFAECSSRLRHQTTVVNAMPQARSAAEFYALYAAVDLTLAMRVHALSPSIGLGTPTLALCSQRRMSAFMEDCGLDEQALDLFAADLGERLEARILALLDDPEAARRRQAAATRALRRRTADWNGRVEKLVSEGATA